ncbi:MAG: hypothetical protein HYU97_11605 [Deltaproteobacteria bacterium]|nr:hypothetical protein [Deltaproteobacteria bacterium]
MKKNFSCGVRAFGLNASFKRYLPGTPRFVGSIDIVNNHFSPSNPLITMPGVYIDGPAWYNYGHPGVYRIDDPGIDQLLVGPAGGGHIYRPERHELCLGNSPSDTLKCFSLEKLPEVAKAVLYGGTLADLIEAIKNAPSKKPSPDDGYVSDCWADDAASLPLDLKRDLIKNPHIKIEVHDLNRFNIPRILSVGNTSFDVEVSFPHTEYEDYFSRPEIWLHNLSMAIEPMVYATNNEGATTLAILGGNIWSEEKLEWVFSQDGKHFLSFTPGIKIDGYYPTFQPVIDGTLRFSLDLLTPFGKVNLTGSLLIHTTLVLEKDGPSLIHQETYLQLKDLHLTRADGSPIFEHLNVILTDMPPFGGKLAGNQPGFSLTLLANTPHDNNNFYTRLDLPIWPDRKEKIFLNKMGIYNQTSGPYRSYNFKHLLESLRLNGYLKYVTNTGTWQGILDVKPLNLKTALLPPFDEPFVAPSDSNTAHNYQLDFAFSKTTPTGEKAFEQSGGRIYLGFGKNGQSESIFNLRGNIDQLNIGDYLHINNIGTSVRINQAKLGEHTAAVTIQEFDVWANQAGSDIGLVRGPINLRLNDPQRPLQITWDSSNETVSFQSLDLPFSVQGFHLPIFPKKSGGRIFAVGIDGRLIGDCNNLIYSLDHFVGDCQIALVGNQKYLKTPEGEYVKIQAGTKVPNPYFKDPRFDPNEGDIYLLGPTLKKVGPPIVRNAQWTAFYFGRKPYPEAPLAEWTTGFPKMTEVFVNGDTWMPIEEAQNLELTYSKKAREVLKGYLLGAYLLIIDINTIPLAPFGVQVGFDGTARMRHEDMYIMVPRGVETREADYLKFLWNMGGK